MYIGRALGNPVITHGCPIRSDTPTIRTQSVSVARRHTYLIASWLLPIPPYSHFFPFFLSFFPRIPLLFLFPNHPLSRPPLDEFPCATWRKKSLTQVNFFSLENTNVFPRNREREFCSWRRAKVYLVATNFYALWLVSFARLKGGILGREGNVANLFIRSDDESTTCFRSQRGNATSRRNWYGRFNKRVVVNIFSWQIFGHVWSRNIHIRTYLSHPRVLI